MRQNLKTVKSDTRRKSYPFTPVFLDDEAKKDRFDLSAPFIASDAAASLMTDAL